MNHIRQLKLFIRINLRRAKLLLLWTFPFFIFWNFLSRRVLHFFRIRIWNLNFFFHWFFWTLWFFIFFRFGTFADSFGRFFISRYFFFRIFRSLLFFKIFRTFGSFLWIISRNDILNFIFLAFLGELFFVYWACI